MINPCDSFNYRGIFVPFIMLQLTSGGLLMAENNNIENKDNNTDKPHKRRIRYSGKYPKRYEEKYKELNPEKYTDIVEHVKAKGNTPAGMHISIMKQEIADFLQVIPGMRGADCTFGYGGHSEMFLKALDGKGHLVSLDVDPIESEKSKARLRNKGYGEAVFDVRLTNFANIDQVADEFGKFDFLLADLGVSSMQIDNPERGFSYKIEGNLDLRMDPTKGITAAERLMSCSREELEELFIVNADEPYADYIAKEVIQAKRTKNDIKTTGQFKEVIENALKKAKVPEAELKEAVKKSCQRCFQALRIDINGEYDALESLMNKLPEVMNPGGRIAILTFHSGEDRIVKQYFKEFARQGIYDEVARDVIRPGAKECNDNPRARSTKMRWAIRK